MSNKSTNYYWGVFSNTRRFFIADKQFNVLFEEPAFNKHDGNFTVTVNDAIKRFGIEYIRINMRTDKNIDQLKKSISLDDDLLELYIKRTVLKKNHN